MNTVDVQNHEVGVHRSRIDASTRIIVTDLYPKSQVMKGNLVKEISVPSLRK